MTAAERVWYGSGGAAATARAALWPFARAYGAAIWVRSRLYAAGIFRTTAAELPTISVGNLTVGGTGKTPVSAWIVSRLRGRAHPGVVLRGYGDDEMEVHRHLNPDVPVIATPDRAAGIRDARERGANVVVLDDAFQHLRIGRTADVVLVSAEQLMRPRRLLPSGPWREPLAAARRADLLVVTLKTATDAVSEQARSVLRKVAPDVPIATIRLTSKSLVDATSGVERPLSDLRGMPVLAIAAIGEPRLFKEQLEASGARVSLAAYRDHHSYSANDIMALGARVPPGGFPVCTLKDAVKLAGRWPGPSRLWYVSQQLVVEQGADEFDRLLMRVLGLRAAAPLTAG